MTSILYPVANNADQALAAPKGRAARQREAMAVAGEAVTFVTDTVGPSYATREAALDAYAGRIDDDRPGRTLAVAVEDRYCRLTEQAAAGKARARALTPVQPTYRDGRRWPEAREAPATVWRLTIGYWRIGEVAAAETAQARHARKRSREEMDPAALRALTRQPLQPIKPQQPLDIGLFETRLPESPHIIVPDE